MAVLSVENVSLTYQADTGETTALRDISFTVEQGEFLSIVGPSGCGKSTLLSLIAGMLAPTAGRILLGGEPVRAPGKGKGNDRHRVGYMLQQDNLLEWRSVRQNVLLGLEIRHALTPESRRWAEELLETYGLSAFGDCHPSQLSGGMRQRVALIRTLAVRPELLLLDEAFSALDYQTRLAVTEDVYGIIRREGVTAVMVTHDIPESISMGDEVLILSRRPAGVKKKLPLRFSVAERTPMACRNAPEFAGYYQAVWKELGMDETDE